MAIKLETDERRSRTMSRIRSKDTKPELALRKALRELGLIGYRKNMRGVPGTPDIAFTKYKLAVFVDGDFWHGRGFDMRKSRLAAGNNGSFWVSKIEHNMVRDRKNEADLTAMGWSFVRFWGSDVLRDATGCARIVFNEIEMVRSNAI